MRLAYYAGASTAAAAACLLKAFHQRPNFYSATVYLSQSNACLLILTNLLLVMACSFMFALQRLLYGPLRPIEIEQLSEKAWYAVLDTLLAMPSFREDVGGWLLAMFVLLLAGKVWGWIGEGRVDVLEQQPPANPRLFHARLATSLIVSVVFDACMFNYCLDTVISDPRPGMMVIFTFEFAILTVFSIFTLLRYSLSLMEVSVIKQQTKQAIEVRKSEIRAERMAARQDATEDGTPTPASSSENEPIEVDENEVDVPGWEEKRRYLFGLEVVTDFVKLMIYIFFFTVSITFNGLPMHIMRDVYMTFASFSKRVSDYVAYRKATSDMNSRYPDATTEEIRGDACIVCRESMVAWEQTIGDAAAQPAADQQPAGTGPIRRRDEGLRAKKLPCGHILHLRCLKAWLERQQVCPTCRRPVITAATQRNPAAVIGDQAAQGQQGQQQGQRPRARMFNLGPLRVGLLNAPNNQMQNILNQLQNPDVQNQNAANQQGPNHLGLQVPYTNQAAAGQQATTPARSSRAAVPVNIQLMQIEQRIMQEAHNLGIEQQQLINLRAMEAELARLRAQHLSTQQTVGTNSTQGQAQQLLQMPLQDYTPSQSMTPLQQHQSTQSAVELHHGNAVQQLGSGDANLPEGLVLPEGWTLMPLQRMTGTQPAINVHGQQRNQPTPQMDQQSTTAPTIATTVAQQSASADPPTAIDPSPAVTNSAAPAARAEKGEGPRDERGSPFFVPAHAAHTNVELQPVPASSAAQMQPSGLPNEEPSSVERSSAPAENKTSWGGDSWSFVDQPSDSAADSPNDAGRAQSSLNGHLREQSQPQGNHGGKGKGRAVEMEDAPDAEAGS